MVESISRDDIDAAWLAGIWDGEGCIHTGINRSKSGRYGASHPLRLEVPNTNPYLIQRITEILHRWNVRFVVLLIDYEKYKYPKNHQSQLKILIQSTRSCCETLRRVLPYLTAKREEAQAMFDYCQWRIERFGEDLRGHSERKKAMQLEVYERKVVLYNTLRRLKDRRYRLQRLPRGYSEPLSLANVEMYYDESGRGRGRKKVVAE